MGNTHLIEAKKKKDDEFYTKLEDIQKELDDYDFSDKVIYCPCDSAESQFVNYFTNYNKPKKLIYTWDDYHNHYDLFQEADIIITNPPFSLLKDFYAVVMNYNKQFYVISPKTAICNSWSSKYLGKYRCGKNAVNKFDSPDGEKSAPCVWITTFPEDRPLIDFPVGVNTGISVDCSDGSHYIRVGKIQDVKKEPGRIILVPQTIIQKNYNVEVLGLAMSCHRLADGWVDLYLRTKDTYYERKFFKGEPFYTSVLVKLL